MNNASIKVCQKDLNNPTTQINCGLQKSATFSIDANGNVMLSFENNYAGQIKYAQLIISFIFIWASGKNTNFSFKEKAMLRAFAENLNRLRPKKILQTIMYDNICLKFMFVLSIWGHC